MAEKPNIVVVLVDDMGYSDIGCCGGRIQTPNLDGLAKGGIRFTHFYNTARCCPARAALLTGLYPHSAGMGWMTAAYLGSRGYAGDLNNRCVTLAEALRPAGYATYMSGKWHLTYQEYLGMDGPKHSWPCQRGFDRYFGILSGAGSYFTPNTLRFGNDAADAGEGFYLTDAITDHACGFIGDHCDTEQEKPFLLYIAYTAPHWPLHGKEEDIGKYRGSFLKGWDVLRAEKFERMRGMGLLDEGGRLSDRDPEVPAWNDLSREKQEESDLKMAIYAAQVDCVDQGVDRIVGSLEKHGVLEDTLILFMSDNGGCHEEVHKAGSSLKDFGTDNSFESYGRPWANLSNAPFRLFKSWVHEGGIATPLIAHWPRGIDPRGSDGRGGFCRWPAHFVDVMPTCLELAGAGYPPEAEGDIHPLEGTSLVPAFHGKEMDRDCLFWEHEANRALRKGRWKIVTRGQHGPWELYDMERDRTELNDLSNRKPGLTRELVQQWIDTALRLDVFPLDGRSWKQRIDEQLVPRGELSHPLPQGNP
jgi:arylsulfatase